ncbi:MAG TPA: DUF2203 domain-containing protein [Gaiellaceae bacterium]|nr:DUF2203 domain-containing protein [Gaiellaceae bacterium]
MPKRLFTPAEANSALDEVRPVAERLVALRTRMHELVGEQGKLVTAIGGNGGGYAANDLNAAQAELEQLADRAAACIAELDSIGVVLKDPDVGLLDFPALRDGEEIELCWQVGEPAVEQWHEIGAGYAGRKPIDWVE